jgi:HK97 family phage prohead protease
MHLHRIERKDAADDTDMTFSGYGAVFGNVDSYGDVLVKGAFTETLRKSKRAGQWPAMLMQHGGMGFSAADMTPIGIWTDMHEDDTGLYVEGKLAPTARGLEAYQLLKMTPRPAISGLSIGYLAKEWSQRTRPEDPRRTLKAVELIEVSLVTSPANAKARVQAVKSIDDLKSLAEAEDYLKSVGLSKSQATAFISRIKRFGPGDPGEGAPPNPGEPDEAAMQELMEALRRRGQAFA